MKAMTLFKSAVVFSVLITLVGCAPSHSRSTNDSCVYAGTSYSEGSVVCQNGYEYRCGGGQWQATGAKCDSADGAIISGKGLAITKNTVSSTSLHPASPESATLQCLSFFAAGIGKVGIRNNCSECKMAVVNWLPNAGIRKYRVSGYNQIVIDTADQTGLLIGEDPCP